MNEDELLRMKLEGGESVQLRRIVGYKIKALRYKKGLYLSELARIIGIRSGSLSRYENGAATPHPHIMARLCRELGVSVSYIFSALSLNELLTIPCGNRALPEYRQILGLKLKVLRYENCLTTAETAKKMGVGKRIVSKWESAEKIPSPQNLRKLSAFFNVELSLLLLGIRENDLAASGYVRDGLKLLKFAPLKELLIRRFPYLLDEIRVFSDLNFDGHPTQSKLAVKYGISESGVQKRRGRIRREINADDELRRTFSEAGFDFQSSELHCNAGLAVLAFAPGFSNQLSHYFALFCHSPPAIALVILVVVVFLAAVIFKTWKTHQRNNSKLIKLFVYLGIVSSVAAVLVISCGAALCNYLPGFLGWLFGSILHPAYIKNKIFVTLFIMAAFSVIALKAKMVKRPAEAGVKLDRGLAKLGVDTGRQELEGLRFTAKIFFSVCLAFDLAATIVFPALAYAMELPLSLGMVISAYIWFGSIVRVITLCVLNYLRNDIPFAKLLSLSWIPFAGILAPVVYILFGFRKDAQTAPQLNSSALHYYAAWPLPILGQIVAESAAHHYSWLVIALFALLAGVLIAAGVVAKWIFSSSVDADYVARCEARRKEDAARIAARQAADKEREEEIARAKRIEENTLSKIKPEIMDLIEEIGAQGLAEQGIKAGQVAKDKVIPAQPSGRSVLDEAKEAREAIEELAKLRARIEEEVEKEVDWSKVPPEKEEQLFEAMVNERLRSHSNAELSGIESLSERAKKLAELRAEQNRSTGKKGQGKELHCNAWLVGLMMLAALLSGTVPLTGH